MTPTLLNSNTSSSSSAVDIAVFARAPLDAILDYVVLIFQWKRSEEDQMANSIEEPQAKPLLKVGLQQFPC